MAMGINLASSELERMASELKCPICLSLCKQAASLSCNHCFCTSCIAQSMRRISCCPICKVPAAPREVRPAPQMDSLIAIFKGMVTTAGASLFLTEQPSQAQNAESGKRLAKRKESKREPPNGRGKQKVGVSSHASHSKTMNSSHRPTKRQRRKSQFVSPANMNQRTESGMAGEMMQCEAADLSIQGAVPAPARKKVRAAPRPLYADNAHEAEQSKVLSECSDLKATITSSRMTSSAVPDNEEIHGYGLQGSEAVDLNDEGPVFEQREREDARISCFPTYDNPRVPQIQLTPFFWLQDRVLPSQDEPPTQLTQTQGAARPLRPSFSDLKGSDDDDQPEDINPSDEVAAAEAPDSFDSDTFMWSQRPCSPELTSSPEENFDKLRHLKPKSCRKMEYVLGKEEKNVHGLVGSESKSPLKSAAGVPVEVEPTQTPQLLQEPSRGIRGTLSKCSKLSTLQGGQTSGNVRRRLKSNDHSSFLLNKEDNPLFAKFVAPKKSTWKRTQKDERNPSTSCQESCLKTNLGSRSDDSPVDITAEGTLEPNCAHQQITNKDPVPEDQQNGISGGETGIPDAALSRESLKDGGLYCVFCGSASDSEVAGPLVEYKDTFPSRGQTTIKAVLVHKLCAEWAPDVYFNDDGPRNLACEVTRGQKIKCSSCGMRGAALGCCNKRCKRSFHYPCGRATPGCKWDEDDFVMFCPQHAECKFPARKRCSISPSENCALPSGEEDILSAQRLRSGERRQKWPASPACKWVLCGSGLVSEMKEELSTFASVIGASVVKRWSPNVTHVIAGTDEQGSARRTLKFLLALLQGKWIVKFDWISACLSAGHIIGEDQYEVTSDTNGCRGGPQRSRVLTAARGPKLLEGLSFYLLGEFTSMSKEDLQSLIVAGRGVVLHRKPLQVERPPFNGRAISIVLYDGDNDAAKVAARAEEAKSVALNAGASAVPHTWLLDSVAACELQPTICRERFVNESLKLGVL